MPRKAEHPGRSFAVRGEPSAEERRRRAQRDAQRLLARRARTSGELRAALLRRHSAGVVDDVLAELMLSGSVDDRRTAREWLQYRRETRPLGRLRLEAELRRRGIGPSMIDELLAAYYRDTPESDDLRRAAGSFLSGGSVPKDPGGARRLTARLARRGFSAAEVREELERLAAGLPEQGTDG